MLLADILQEEYALCMSSGFFRFYAHMGVVHALEENNCLRVKACSGSSAGALVAAFLASGMKPADMPERVFTIKRENIWDIGIGLGLLKGQLLQQVLEHQFPVTTFEECPIPVGISAYDVFGFKTNCINSGDLATAVRASCCFPGLFQPVSINSRLHIDGGVWDSGGLMALPSVPASNLIVNIVCGRGRIGSSVLPDRFKDARLLTLVLDNIPNVSPFNMDKDGPLAFSTARAATFQMLKNGHLQQLGHNHWCAYIEGSSVDLRRPLNPLPSRSNPVDDNCPETVGVATDVDRQARTENITKRPSFQFHATARGSGGVSTENLVNLSISSLDTTNSSSSSSAMINNMKDDDKIVSNKHGKNEVISIPKVPSSSSSSSSSFDGNTYQHENEKEIKNYKIKSEDVIVSGINESKISPQKSDKITGKRSLSVEHDRDESVSNSEPLTKTIKISKIPRVSRIPKRRVSIGKTHFTRQESSSLQKVLKRERRTSFKLLD